MDEFIDSLSLKFDTPLSADEKEALLKELKAYGDRQFVKRFFSTDGRVIDLNKEKYDKMFFTNLRNGIVSNCEIKGDLSGYVFLGVKFINVKFHEDVKFPRKKKFFRDVCSFTDCELPPFEFKNYDLKENPGEERDSYHWHHAKEKFIRCRFHPKTKLPEYHPNIIFKECVLPPIDFCKDKFFKFGDSAYLRCTFAKETNFGSRFRLFKYGLEQFRGRTFGTEEKPLFYLPAKDYSNFDFFDVDFSLLRFEDGSILPQQKEFFRTLQYSSLSGCVIPKMDLSIYDFRGVKLEQTIFSDGCILPDDIELFQKINKKSLYHVTLPSGDYSKYDFSNVGIDGLRFTEDSIIPTDILDVAKIRRHLLANKWPLQAIRDIFLYKEPPVKIDLRENHIPHDLLCMLHAKYRNSSVVMLPEMENK